LWRVNRPSSMVVPLLCMPMIKTGFDISVIAARADRPSFDLTIKTLFTVRNKTALHDCNSDA
ncbi:MAG TPA: hypothetical protein VMJ94_00955, partial [Nitrososphaera sp.]|nr:hypothetical protein [Nitrososphaera sp.]